MAERKASSGFCPNVSRRLGGRAAQDARAFVAPSGPAVPVLATTTQDSKFSNPHPDARKWPRGPGRARPTLQPSASSDRGRLRRLVYLRRQRRRSPLDRSDPSGVNHQALHEVPEIAHRGAPDSRITPPSGLRGVLHRPLVRRATPYRHRVVRWCHRSLSICEGGTPTAAGSVGSRR